MEPRMIAATGKERPDVKPQIVVPDEGALNLAFEKHQKRIETGKLYRSAAMVCIIPTRGTIHHKVVQSWFTLMAPMNHPFVRLFVAGMEVGDAYQHAVEWILAQKDTIAKWPYILTLEEDNMPPPDGILKLVEAIEGGVDGKKYDVMSGLYWTKGEGGQPMIYGDPNQMPLNFFPQKPLLDTVQRCNGLGMGFTLFRMKIFTEGKIEKPWFKTVQRYVPMQGTEGYTQDLWFFKEAAKNGYMVACDTRVKVGHYDAEGDLTW